MRKDLIILVPDKNTQYAIDAILKKYQSLKIKKIEYDIFVHHGHDPGIYKTAASFLRPFLNLYQYALVFVDREGSGTLKTETEIHDEIYKNLVKNGWEQRSEIIVFDPELEIWSFVNSVHFANILGWNSFLDLKKMLIENGLWKIDSPKPHRPKEAFELCLKTKRIKRSSSIYKKIAQIVTFEGCIIPSFMIFKNILEKWFGDKDEQQG